MTTRIGFFSLLYLLIAGFSQAQPFVFPPDKFPDLPAQEPVSIGQEALTEAIDLSNRNRGLSKISAIDDSGRVKYSNSEFWPKGAWFRGYASEVSAEELLRFFDGSRTIYFGTHPLYRYTSQQVRAMIHLHPLVAQNDSLAALVEEVVEDGTRHLLNDFKENDYYTWFYERPGQFKVNSNEQRIFPDSLRSNVGHIYETGHVLATLCDVISFKKSRGMELDYELVEKTGSVAKTLIRKEEESSSSNYSAFALWSISKAFKVSLDTACLIKMKEICGRLLRTQTRDLATDNPCQGVWRVGQEGEGFHEGKMSYHLIVLKSLWEAIDALPRSEKDLRLKLRTAIRAGMNHIAMHRMRLKEDLTVNDFSLEFYGPDTNCVVGGQLFQYLFYDDALETFALAAYYSKINPELFDSEEQQAFVGLLHHVAQTIDTAVDPIWTNELTAAKCLSSMAYYLDYWRAVSSDRLVFEEDGWK